MKLMEEMLRANKDLGEEKPEDPFDALDAEDELGKIRQKRGAA
jgi:hypothetical protein